jgi:hypothetical protein
VWRLKRYDCYKREGRRWGAYAVRELQREGVKEDTIDNKA